MAEEKALVDDCAAAESLSGLASAKSGARLWLADGLVPLFGAFRELVFEREEGGGVQRGEAVCLRFRWLVSVCSTICDLRTLSLALSVCVCVCVCVCVSE